MDDFAHIVGEDVHFRGRSPSGERGLKFIISRGHGHALLSLPIRGAWIEIVRTPSSIALAIPSLPIRGAWIEITPVSIAASAILVAPHPGSVD